MGPHDHLVMQAQKWKEELWAYIEEFYDHHKSHPKAVEAKNLMNALLDTIDSFVDEPEYK